jgi:hypothetical protein
VSGALSCSSGSSSSCGACGTCLTSGRRASTSPGAPGHADRLRADPIDQRQAAQQGHAEHDRWHLLGLATEQDVIDFLNKPDNTGVKKRAKDELWKKLGY